MPPQKSPPPSPSRPAPPEKRRGSLWAVLFAGMFGVGLFIGLVLLAGPLGPVVLGIGGIVLILLAFTAGHYLLWGYWLSDSIHREVEEEERRGTVE